MDTAPKFRLHLTPVAPNGFGPTGLAVFDVGLVGYVSDGDVVEAIGPVTEDLEGVAFRAIRTASGWTGRVTWPEYDGFNGFEAL